jgi:hypothetical protein
MAAVRPSANPPVGSRAPFRKSAGRQRHNDLVRERRTKTGHHIGFRGSYSHP